MLPESYMGQKPFKNPGKNPFNRKTLEGFPRNLSNLKTQWSFKTLEAPLSLQVQTTLFEFRDDLNLSNI